MFFTIWVMFWNTSRIFFSFLAYKILRTIVALFFSNSFQLSFSDGKCIPSQLYLFIKSLIFVSLCGSFLISLCDCYSILKTFVIFFVDGIYCWCFCFLSSQENLYMIHHDWDLFYDIDNTITEHNQRQTHYLSLILN